MIPSPLSLEQLRIVYYFIDLWFFIFICEYRASLPGAFINLFSSTDVSVCFSSSTALLLFLQLENKLQWLVKSYFLIIPFQLAFLSFIICNHLFLTSVVHQNYLESFGKIYVFFANYNLWSGTQACALWEN